MEPVSNTHVNAIDLRRIRELVDEIVMSPAVWQTVPRAIARGKSPQSSAFERYMSRVLVDAGGTDIAPLATRSAMQLAPPGEGHMARITCAVRLAEDERRTVESVQDAINRLCGLADALEDSADLADSHPGRVVTISPLGGSYKPERPLYRSAHIPLPPIGANEEPGVAFLNEVDWRALDYVPVTARAVFQSSLLPNMYQGFMGAYAPPGSDWDVRTRLATTLEKLELPLQSAFRFDCSVPDATVALRFSVPPEQSFPRLMQDGCTGLVVPTGNLAREARIVYALRLACLLAAACFGSGRHVEHAQLIADLQGDDGIDLRFNRHDYIHDVMAAVEDGRLFERDLRFNPESLLEVMRPESISWPEAWRQSDAVPTGVEAPASPAGTSDLAGSGDYAGSVDHAGFGDHAGFCDPACCRTRISPHEDDRPLTEELSRIFHAERIRDIDTRHFHGPGERTIEEARFDSDESILAAIASLEQAITGLEAECVPPNDDSGARPLFCSNPLARAVVSLLDDDLSVGREAEEFLNGPRDARRTGLRYFRAPDALFQAHVGLSDLYARLGDYRGAESEADRCIALAPTTAQSYYLKANALAQQYRYAEAANVLSAGLRVAVSERDCALLYYHLALALWKLGRRQESVSVHVYAMSLAGEYAEKSAAVVRSLRQRKNVPVIVHASPLAATREMARARIPLAPSDEARTLVVQAAIGLSCADAPLAAAPYAAALTRYFRNDAVISATADSIRRGLGV